MSKMFDALRRAEEERKRRAQAKSDEGAAKLTSAQPRVVEEPSRPTSEHRPTVTRESSNTTPVPTPVPNKTNVALDLPEEFLKEIGVLRNSIEASLKLENRKSVLFTSANHEEGTTTLTTSLARLLASNPKNKVLICEMNARRPSLLWKFGLQSPSGMTDYLSGDRPLSQFVQSVSASLDVIHVGEKNPAQLQLLAEDGFEGFIAEARESYDYIFIDAPPVVGAPETPPLATHVGGVVLIVHSGKTKREIIQRSIEMIEQFDGKVLGVVLNRKKYYIPDAIYRRI